MAHGFGHLAKIRGIVYYRLSPFEQKAFKGIISKGVPNMVRRIMDQAPYVVPPLALAYIIYDQTEKEHRRLLRKNPADFENDK
ncbi:cytochrome b-c1 complex subunit 8 [Cylas formicarius]|uniref:cytochrome b-c1 complex subunit 8 n=1 Tax=Cylas formicarius TaxID=197179 RepID=UPI002958A035|nr:cytochrome b-c1 complex subunit 8 [Cylas formicarius]